MNKVFLIGNLTRDPELSQTNSGVSVCRIAIAVNRRFSNADGSREVDFFNVSVWRNQADSCAKYLKKGSKVAVSGSIQTRNFERADGTKGFAVDIVADEVEFLSAKNEGEGATISSPEQQPVQQAPVASLQPVDDSDLPF